MTTSSPVNGMSNYPSRVAVAAARLMVKRDEEGKATKPLDDRIRALANYEGPFRPKHRM
nr:hypothetical protein [Corynebacterium lactis]